MGTSILKGQNYSFDNGVIRFYEAKAFRTGNNWAINWSLFGDFFIEVDPDPTIVDDIKMCIDTDVASGNGDKISMVLVDSRNAAKLFLLGIIKTGDLRKIKEYDEYIEIPCVKIHERFLKVRVMQQFDQKCATADAEGNVL